MKTSDIRIGDIVSVDNLTECKVIEIKEKHLRVEYIREDTQLPHRPLIEIERISPVHEYDMKKETLEEAAECECKSHHSEEDFIRGAKWQLENMPIHIYAENTYVHIEDGTIIVEKNDNSIISYSEDDLREAFKQSRQCKIFEKDMPPVYEEFEEWFEQFKKK